MRGEGELELQLFSENFPTVMALQFYSVTCSPPTVTFLYQYRDARLIAQRSQIFTYWKNRLIEFLGSPAGVATPLL